MVHQCGMPLSPSDAPSAQSKNKSVPYSKRNTSKHDSYVETS